MHLPNYPCKNDWWGRTISRDPSACKSPIFNLFSLVAPQLQHLAKKLN